MTLTPQPLLVPWSRKSRAIPLLPLWTERPVQNLYKVALYFIVIIIIIIIEFFTSQLWLGNIHLSWDVVINRIRLGGLTCSLKSFLQLNMCQELEISGAS